MKENLKAFFPALIWALIILYLSTRGTVSLPPTFADLFQWDKVGHAVFYGVQTFLVLYGFHQLGTLSRSTIIFTAILVSFYGIVLETIQFVYFPGRYFEVYDIVANIIGTLLSLYFIRYFSE